MRTYVRRELYAHTTAAREQLHAARVPGGRVRSAADLSKVRPITLAEAGDGSRFVVRPTRGALLRSASPYMRARTAWASTWGRWPAFLKAIEPRYRPVHFFTADHVPVGAAAGDLVRLSRLGADWIKRVGIDGHDAVALVGGAGSGIEAWELSGGTRRGGVSLAVVDEHANAARHNATVLAGDANAVATALADGAWAGLRLALVFGRSTDAVQAALTRARATEQVALRRAWAVPGGRSVWFECKGGAAQGWHTTPAAEHVELDEDREALWTGLGWAGTVFLRLRTDVIVDAIDESACAACGHQGPRLFFGDGRASLARWLRDDARVADMRLTADGAEVLPVRAGANARLVSDARKAFPDQSVKVLTRKAWAA
ncbi:MAG: hypothetical protein QOJ00_2444 [Actinomycetota bacterium]